MMYENGDSRVYFSDSRQMKELGDATVPLVVTSPPYFNYVDYGHIGIGTEERYETYLDNLRAVFKECYRVLIPDGKVCINITNMKARKDVEGASFMYPIVADVTGFMRDIGYILWDEIIWIKGSANNGALQGKPLFGSYPYPPNPKILDSIFENIIIFKKEGQLKDRVSKNIKEESIVSKEEWMLYTKGIWEINPDRKSDHPASFPFEIPYRLIKIYSFKGEIVLDPFVGSGTTAAIANALGRQGIGYEIYEGYLKYIRERFIEAGNPYTVELLVPENIDVDRNKNKQQLTFLKEE